MLDDDPDDAQLVAWTTTPWTLPSNLSLCVNPNFDYIKVCPPSSFILPPSFTHPPTHPPTHTLIIITSRVGLEQMLGGMLLV